MRSAPMRLIATAMLVAITVGGMSAAPVDAGRQTMAMPALGTNGQMNCDHLTLESATGILRARGNVTVRTDEFDIDSGTLIFDEANSSMTAGGGQVQLQMGRLTAIGGLLHYNTDTGDMRITRGDEGTQQPCVIQRGPESTLTAFADTIIIESDENGETVTRFEGDVHIQTTEAEGEPTSDSGQASPMALGVPGLGNEGEIRCDELVHSGTEGTMAAWGEVRVTTPDLDLQCAELDYQGAQDRLLATGDEVLIDRRDVRGLCTQMTYLVALERILLERRSELDPQPQLWQEREEEIFHAVADLITITEDEQERTCVDWEHNVVLETFSRQPEPTPAVDEPRGESVPIRIESIDDLPGAEIDPFA